MKPYRLNEADIQIPDGWQDNTIQAFSLAGSKLTGPVNFVVTRDSTNKAPDVQAYADQQLVEAAKKLSGYKLIGRRACEIGTRPALVADYTWLAPENIEIQQRQAYVKWGSIFVVFTLSSKAKDFKSHESTWEAIIGSVRLRAE